MAWNIWKIPTGDCSTVWKVPATATVRPVASFTTRSNSPAGKIQVRIVHTTMMENSRI